jgi:hypothetical protein
VLGQTTGLFGFPAEANSLIAQIPHARAALDIHVSNIGPLGGAGCLDISNIGPLKVKYGYLVLSLTDLYIHFIFPRSGMATLKVLVILVAFPPNQWLHERA